MQEINIINALIVSILITLLGIILRGSVNGLDISQANKTIIQVSAVMTLAVLLPAVILFFRQVTSSIEEAVKLE